MPDCVNFNEPVWVQPTGSGKIILAAHDDNRPLREWVDPISGALWVQFETWRLMALFGPHMGMAMAAPFAGGDLCFSHPSKQYLTEDK